MCSFRKFILKLSFMCKGNSKPVLVCKGSENKPSTQTSGKKKVIHQLKDKSHSFKVEKCDIEKNG